MTKPLAGLERVRKACGDVAGYGYDWCDEHRRHRHWGSAPCGELHPKTYPRGSFICEEHGRIHTPDEQAWYCNGPALPYK